MNEIEIFKIGYFAAHARFPAEYEIERFLEAFKEEEKLCHQKNKLYSQNMTLTDI